MMNFIYKIKPSQHKKNIFPHIPKKEKKRKEEHVRLIQQTGTKKIKRVNMSCMRKTSNRVLFYYYKNTCRQRSHKKCIVTTYKDEV